MEGATKPQTEAWKSRPHQDTRVLTGYMCSDGTQTLSEAEESQELSHERQVGGGGG